MANVVIPSNLGPEFGIGTTIPNLITVNVDGTSVVRDASGVLHGASPVYDNVASTITFPAVNGAPPLVIDLSDLAADIFVDGATFDATTGVLTLTDNDAGTPDVTIDLSALTGVSTDANNILVEGADGKPFLDCDTIKNDCTQVCTDAFGVDVFRSFAL